MVPTVVLKVNLLGTQIEPPGAATYSKNIFKGIKKCNKYQICSDVVKICLKSHICLRLCNSTCSSTFVVLRLFEPLDHSIPEQWAAKAKPIVELCNTAYVSVVFLGKSWTYSAKGAERGTQNPLKC